jgi:transposase-like protein
MKSNRKRYDAAFKARVALEAIKGQRTISEIASDYGIHPNQISQWKKHALDQLPELFSGKQEKQAQDSEQLQAELYQQIGQLKVELDWLKKKSRAFA